MIWNNSDSPSRTKQKKDKQMSGNLEMLRPGVQMITTTRNKKAHHKPKHDEHPGVYCHDVIQSSKPVHTYEKEWKLGRFPRLTLVHEHRRSCNRRLTLAAGLSPVGSGSNQLTNECLYGSQQRSYCCRPNIFLFGST